MGKIKKILENELVGGTQSTDVYPVTSTKAVYNEDNENLDSILKRRGTINVSTNYNADHIAEVLTLEQAIAKVPSKDRVLGFTMTFLSSDGWKNYQFTGGSITDWNNIDRWKFIITSSDLKQTTGQSTTTPMSQKAVTDLLNEGYLYAGIATPTTTPTTPKGKVFYIASESGTYTNFGGLSVDDGEAAILKYDDNWVKIDSGIATLSNVAELKSQTLFCSNAELNKIVYGIVIQGIGLENVDKCNSILLLRGVESEGMYYNGIILYDVNTGQRYYDIQQVFSSKEESEAYCNDYIIYVKNGDKTLYIGGNFKNFTRYQHEEGNIIFYNIKDDVNLIPFIKGIIEDEKIPKQSVLIHRDFLRNDDMYQCFNEKSKNLFNKRAVVDGYYGEDGVIYIPHGNYITSDFIAVNNLNKYKVENQGGNLYIYAYDINKKPLVLSNGKVYFQELQDNVPFNGQSLPNELYYIKVISFKNNIDNVMVTIYDEDTSSYIPSYINSINPIFFGNIFLNKTFSVVGDSTSTYEGTIPDGYRNFYTDALLGSVNNMYWKIISNLYNCKLLVNNSYAGSAVSTYNPQGTIPFVKRLDVTFKNGVPDIILINGGINDYLLQQVDLGEINKESDDISRLDKGVFSQAYQYMIEYFISTHPESKIITIVPIALGRTIDGKRAYTFQKNNKGFTFNDYCDRIKEISLLYGIKCIDMRTIGINSYNCGEFLRDDLTHPTILGMKEIFKCIITNTLNPIL